MTADQPGAPTAEDVEALAGLLACHRNALGFEGIMSDGEWAWLRCTCGWRQNVEMTTDDITIAESAWEAHLATSVASDWLAARDAQVKAEALREAADPSVMPSHVQAFVTGPDRNEIAAWLRDRADRITQGGEG